MYREMYEQQAYRFQAKAEAPFIIDGGANIGLGILYFKELYPKSEIIGFEPDEKIFSVLERNILRCALANVKLLCQALWSAHTTLGFISEGSWAGRLARAGDHRGHLVRTVRLRDYLDRPVDFLKLDIEGAETEVSLGLRRSAGKGRKPVCGIPLLLGRAAVHPYSFECAARSRIPRAPACVD